LSIAAEAETAPVRAKVPMAAMLERQAPLTIGRRLLFFIMTMLLFFFLKRV